jgi:eukaryotic-like serine/threonine-protein kinase
MNAERWQQVKPILESALALDAESRKAFLDSACADISLRIEVESLLDAHDGAGTNALSPGGPLRIDTEAELRFRLTPGKRVGAYEIIEEIAQGGMGAVYRAVRADGQYKQQVALKIVRSELGVEVTAARFRNERQILAGLDHPNIARILDGGATAEGLPYFVMEFIDGLPVIEYGDKNKLNIDERLKIFRTVCSAVHYAHQHLVVHRDIKPSNILITADGVPKLVDFGIAKVLDSSLLPHNATLTAGFWLMTPEYASPEQLRGEAITTASDVYSLGLVLYELLTGRSPHCFRSRAPHEISRAVLEAEPEKPSASIGRRESLAHADDEKTTLSPEAVADLRNDSLERLQRRVSGDLDNIVMKAIRKEPRERYTSVDQLSEDIRRHLEGLPVLARKSTVAYRSRKFILRHKPTVAAAALLSLSLITGVALTLREARIARANQLHAEQRFNDVRELAHSLMFEIHDGISNLPGSTPVRQLIVEKALRYLDSLSQEAAGDLSLQRELAAAYDRVGELQWSVDYANQGDSVGALRSYRKALAIRESLTTLQPNDTQLQIELVDGYFRLAQPLESTGDFVGALEVLQKAPPIIERIAARSSDPKIRDRQGGSYYYLGRIVGQMGDPAGALENYRKAAAIQAAIIAADPREAALLKTHLAGDNTGIAECMMRLGNLSEAIRIQAQAVQTLEELSQAYSTNTSLRGFLGNAYDFLGTMWKKRRDPVKALHYYRRDHEIFRELRSADPANELAQVNLAFSDESIGEAQIAIGDIGGGLDSIRESLAAFEAMAARGAKDRYVLSGKADCYFALGMAYSSLAANSRLPGKEQRARWQEAQAWYAKSSGIWAEKRSHGALDYSESETADAVAQGIARCNVALLKIEHPTDTRPAS